MVSPRPAVCICFKYCTTTKCNNSASATRWWFDDHGAVMGYGPGIHPPEKKTSVSIIVIPNAGFNGSTRTQANETEPTPRTHPNVCLHTTTRHKINETKKNDRRWWCSPEEGGPIVRTESLFRGGVRRFIHSLLGGISKVGRARSAGIPGTVVPFRWNRTARTLYHLEWVCSLKTENCDNSQKVVGSVSLWGFGRDYY